MGWSQIMRIKSQSDIDEGMKYLFDISAELKAVSLIAEDVPLRLGEPNFAGLTSIVMGQQVSRASAVAIIGRLNKLVTPLTVQNYLKAGETAWIEAGLSRPKQKTMLAVCDAITSGTLDLEGLCDLPPKDAMEEMVSIKGIGPWTAEVYLLFSAGHADIFPAGDLALQEAVKQAFNLNERPSDKVTRGIAEQWSPWRGVAARLLWNYYAVMQKGRDGSPV